MSSAPPVSGDLPPGLRLRRATMADRDAFAALTAELHIPDGADRPDEDLRRYIEDLFDKGHPQTSLDRMLVIEDTATGAIAAKLVMLSQRWTYAGIPFMRGRPEFVSTAPAYRGLGLAGHLMDAFHRESGARGELVQAISGIRHYYRRFGYEYALESAPYRSASRETLLNLVDSSSGRYSFRPADTTNIPYLIRLGALGAQRWLVTGELSEADWRHELTGLPAENAWKPRVSMIERPEGSPVGAVYLAARLYDGTLYVKWCELDEGERWESVLPDLLAYIEGWGEEVARRKAHSFYDPPDTSFTRIGLVLGDAHPLSQPLEPHLAPLRTRSALYLRVPDLPAFLRHIAPALEARLAASERHAGHTGEVRLSFFTGGVTLRFVDGHLMAVAPWRGLRTGDVDALFPDLTFLKLLFGYRSLGDLEYAYPDCRALTDEAFSLLSILFPAAPSWTALPYF